MSKPPLPQREDQGPSSWKPRRQLGFFASLTRLLVLVILSLMLVLPFTPFAGKIKTTLKELIQAIREKNTTIVTREVTREVSKEVPVEVIKEVIKEVPVPTPPPPLPNAYIARKDVDVATLFNGITVKTNLLTEQGTFASLERLDPNAYKAEFQLSVRVPKANQSVAELARINKELPQILPDLEAMLTTGKVSGFYHKLYDNKTNAIQHDLTRLNRILDRHNFFDCETILELTHPTSKRKALLIQSEMDVVADGSDGDRQPTLDEYIYMSDYYQPFTSYAWAKRTTTPNPLLGRWEERLKKANENAAVKGLSADKKREFKAIANQLEVEVKELKSRSSLIAEKDPFIVLSLLFRPYAAQNKHTPQIGDYAVVIHEGKMYPAICGDYGPSMKMGEASMFICKTINDKATPYRRPESDLKVTYLIFPGTAEKPNGPPNLDRWHEQCALYLKEIGAPGPAHSLHKWEDPFKKPEPPPAIGGLAPATAASGAATAGATPAAAPGTPGAPATTPTAPGTPPTPSQSTPPIPGGNPQSTVPGASPTPSPSTPAVPGGSPQSNPPTTPNSAPPGTATTPTAPPSESPPTATPPETSTAPKSTPKKSSSTSSSTKRPKSKSTRSE